MRLTKLWEKLFSRKNDTDEIALHISGATVRHRNPFENPDVTRNEDELTEEFVDKWVMPFYMAGFANVNAATKRQFATAAKEITQNDVELLLGDFDWRPRSCGAYFAAINNYAELDNIIGRHLVKSEVCYAGGAYSAALAMFNTDTSKKYLRDYLNYYLDRPDLHFDQADAFCALERIDSAAAFDLLDKWRYFSEGKTHLDLNKARSYFNNSIGTIKDIREMML